MYSTEIGKYVKSNQFGYFNMQTKYIMLLSRHALENVDVNMRSFASQLDYRSGGDLRSIGNPYGIDVYHNVATVHPFQELSVSSTRYTWTELQENIPHWLRTQRIKLKAEDPTTTDDQLIREVSKVESRLNMAIKYLMAYGDPDKTVQVRRFSGIRHKIQLKPNTAIKRVTYSNLLIAMSNGNHLPKLVVKEQVGKAKPSSRSIQHQFETEPHKFLYYDKFGIFEIYDQ